MNFSSITIQGNILSSEIIDKIRNEEDKFRQNPADFSLERKASVRDEIGVAWSAAKAHYTAFSLRIDRLREGDTLIAVAKPEAPALARMRWCRNT